MTNTFLLRAFFCLILFMSFMNHELSAQVAIDKTGEEWILTVDGEPFDIKGATFGYVDDVNNYDTYFTDLSFLGVNSIRTWATGENAGKLLDAAHKYGIKVMMGIWMRHGRPGMEDDDSFNYLEDETGIQAMYDNAIRVVETYKDHPAVLTWGIGNEVYLNMATDEEKLAYSELLEKICAKIKELDPNHPITSVEAWTFGLEWWEKYVPSLDIYGLNSYGPGADLLAGELSKRGIDKPYIVTEFGVTGEWDRYEDTNGITVEPDDQQKYEAIADGYRNWISDKSSNLGVYVFHYGNNDNFGASWLLTHLDGMTRPQYWAIRDAYTSKEPVNRVPEIHTFSLAETNSDSDIWIPVTLAASDAEQEKLEISFHYNQRTGSRKLRDQVLPLNSKGNLQDGFQIQLPKVNGPIKVYAYAKDTFNNVGVATTSVVVSDVEAAKKKFLVPQASLPFYVYKDNGDLPYTPSGYMGNYQAMEVDLNYSEDVHSGETAIKIRYNENQGWYGLAFMDPANDWGDILGGYDLSDAKTFSFWARADGINVKATIGFGLIEDDKTYPDTDKKSIEINLTKNWKKYTLKTRKMDLSTIRTGFVLFSASDGFRHTIYLDDIIFE